MTDFSKMLRIISRAWGRNQSGYCFFPWIDREAQERTGERRAGFHEGPAFMWPEDKPKILKHLEEHRQHDLYWCPSLFEFPHRKAEAAMDEMALWADLDEADPREIDPEYEPTIAWETSPGRYQALWILSQGDIRGASWPGNENQRLTYYVGADSSGWDTTQLLRVPGTKNYKPDRRDKRGKPPTGRLLWMNKRTYLADDFDDLPPVQGALPASQLADVIEDEISTIDRHEVIARVKLKLNRTARDLLSARTADGPQGTRGDNLWYLIRCLADAGCTVAEIVAVVRDTVWNKFEDRADEIKRLINEASKAIAQRDPEIEEQLEEERKAKPAPQRLALVLKNLRPPEWLIKDIIQKGGCGFISGEPKSYKSWFALDMALSVSTGAPFLGYFHVMEPGPVLYIQEEDSGVLVRDRSTKIWRGKSIDRMSLVKGEVIWDPPQKSEEFDPDINAYMQEGFVLSEGHWQEWLDETLAEGMDGRPYLMVLIDTLMQVAGDVEDKAQPMTNKLLKPTKLLARKHNTSAVFVNHMKKSGEGLRGGQRMLGSQALHAWSEDALYITRGKTGKLLVERESKSAPEMTFTVDNVLNTRWEPVVITKGQNTTESTPDVPGQRRRPGPTHQPAAYKGLQSLGPGAWTVRQVANAMGENTSYQSALRQLQRLAEKSLVEKNDNLWSLKSTT